MKTVTMKAVMRGPKGTYQPGQKATFDDETADALVEGGHAEYAPEPPKFEIVDRDEDDKPKRK